MNIKFLGTGGFDDLDCGTSSAIIEHPQGAILLDCGSSIYERLRRKKLDEKIDYVLLTHLHGDHMGSLFSLIANFSVIQKRKLSILCPDDNFKKLVITLCSLWFGDYTEKIELLSLSNFKGIQSIDTYGKHFKGIQTYAYVFEDQNSIIYYSGDLNDISVTTDFLKTCDQSKQIRLFHEVTWSEKGKTVHCYYKELKEALSGYETYLYHCDHLAKPDDCIFPCVAEIADLCY